MSNAVLPLPLAAGFDGLELVENGPVGKPANPNCCKQYMAQYQLPVLALHGPIWFYIPGWPGDQVGRLKCTVELAETIGAQVVVHHLPTRVAYFWVMAGARSVPVLIPGFNFEAGYKRWLETEYAAFQGKPQSNCASKTCLLIAVSGNVGTIAIWNRPEQIVRFPAITMDTTHLGTWGLDPATIYDLWRERSAYSFEQFCGKKEHLRPQTGELPARCVPATAQGRELRPRYLALKSTQIPWTPGNRIPRLFSA